MAKPQKCIIISCDSIVCPRCQHWYDPSKPEQAKEHKTCHERAPSGIKRNPACVNCRHSFGYHGKKSFAERDRSDRRYLKSHERIVYVNQHPVRANRSKEKQVRTTRATNRAPNIA